MNDFKLINAKEICKCGCKGDALTHYTKMVDELKEQAWNEGAQIAGKRDE